MEMTRGDVYLCRHATPDFNRRDIPYHIPPGPPLVEKGLIEAEALGQFLRPLHVTRMAASPLERCWHTAKIASGVGGYSYEILDNLKELYPNESLESVQGRTYPILEKAWLDSLTGCPVVLVTHGGVVQALLLKLGMSKAKVVEYTHLFDHANPIPPAGAWKITRNCEDIWEMELVFQPQLAMAD
jgi:broad specificity phosphatase PhoE